MRPKKEGFADAYSKFIEQSSTSSFPTKHSSRAVVGGSTHKPPSSSITNNKKNMLLPEVSVLAPNTANPDVMSRLIEQEQEQPKSTQTVLLTIEPTTIAIQEKKVTLKKISAVHRSPSDGSDKQPKKKHAIKSINVVTALNASDLKDHPNSHSAIQLNNLPEQGTQLVYVDRRVLPKCHSQSSVSSSLTSVPKLNSRATIRNESTTQSMPLSRPLVGVEAPSGPKVFKGTKVLSLTSAKLIADNPNITIIRQTKSTTNADKTRSVTIMPAYQATNNEIVCEAVPHGSNAFQTTCLNNTGPSLADVAEKSATICYIQSAKNSNCIKTK